MASIVAGAATLADRLGPGWTPAADAMSDGRAAARLDRWRDRVAPGDPSGFADRLGWIGWTERQVLPRLGEGSLDVAPDWAAMFGAAMARMGTAIAEAAPHPFGALLTGFVAAALDRLPPGVDRAIAPAARSVLVDDLVIQLSHLASPALQVEFAAARGVDPGPGDAAFRAFADRMTGGGLWDFFAEYGALARLLSVAAMQWSAHVAALAGDFVADRAAIAERFGGAVPDMITAIEPSLSDAHNGGRSVAIVTLSTGLRLAYKPRPVGIEAGWFALLAALDGVAGEFRVLRVLARGDRGWVELALHRPCRDGAEAVAFYRRAGNLLALLYALEASDCFHENIVAEGGYPVLIDMETLMHHVVRPPPAAAAAETAAGDILFDSVLRAGLLPVWEAGRDGLCVDISGLGAEARQTTPYLRRRWTDLHTDRQALHHQAIEVESVHHLPFLEGVALRAADHVEAVVAGFRQTYAALIDRRDALLAPGGHLAALSGEMLRLVFHPTRLYGLMLKRLATPKGMRTGIDRSIEFDVLARFYVGSAAKQPYRALLEAELAALERSDIPYFTVRADDPDLAVPGGGRIANAFAETAIERVAARLMRFDSADLARQTEFIRASLIMSSTMAHGAEGDGRVVEPGVRSAAPAPRAPATDADLVAAAAAIARDLRARAVTAADGSVSWIAPQLLPNSSRYELRPLRLDLYGGQAGLALFLAALARVTGEGGDFALAALASLRRPMLPRNAETLLRAGHTIGGVTGIGSIVYALVRSATLLDSPDLLADAAGAARLLDRALIDADEEHDVMAGAAGALLGLLALHDALPAAGALERARWCGDHLVRRQAPAGAGAGWRSGRHPPTTGLSHGAAGVALALLRLADRTDDARYRLAAAAALAFEAGAFDSGTGNWQDLRDGPASPPTFRNAWCHGALGIGLARVAGLPIHDSPAVRADIAAALRLDPGDLLAARDGLCCGNLARSELMLLAAEAGEGASHDDARRLAARVLDRAAGRGQFALSGVPGTDFFDPSFFQGLSGIGYQMLRVSSPDIIPPVLTWG